MRILPQCSPRGVILYTSSSLTFPSKRPANLLALMLILMTNSSDINFGLVDTGHGKTERSKDSSPLFIRTIILMVFVHNFKQTQQNLWSCHRNHVASNDKLLAFQRVATADLEVVRKWGYTYTNTDVARRA